MWIRTILKNNGFSPESINLWVAQSKTETDNFQSLLCNKYYNLFGMTVPERRKSLRNGEVFMQGDKLYFSTFANYVKSVKDLLLYVEYTNFPKNIRDIDAFVDKLKSKGYFTASVESYKARMLTFLR